MSERVLAILHEREQLQLNTMEREPHGEPLIQWPPRPGDMNFEGGECLQAGEASVVDLPLPRDHVFKSVRGSGRGLGRAGWGGGWGGQTGRGGHGRGVRALNFDLNEATQFLDLNEAPQSNGERIPNGATESRDRAAEVQQEILSQGQGQGVAVAYNENLNSDKQVGTARGLGRGRGRPPG